MNDDADHGYVIKSLAERFGCVEETHQNFTNRIISKSSHSQKFQKHKSTSQTN
jgi:hypothetical protein